MKSQPAEINHAVMDLVAAREHFSRLTVGERRQLLVECIETVVASADDWIAAGCRAKGHRDSPTVRAEEILNGPAVTLRYLQLTRASLADLERGQQPRLPGRWTFDRQGRLQLPVVPVRGLFDPLNFYGFSAYVRMLPEVTAENLDEYHARDCHTPSAPGVALVLGAGNVSSIPIIDALTKLFQEGQVVLLKMNPVNAYLGPIFERAFAPLISNGYLRIIYGGADVGTAAITQKQVDSIHITGSIDTHDAIVWGPTSDERDRRKREDRPLLVKPITSELGNVSPWIVVPGRYSRRQLRFQAENIAASITNNASFNCVATKLIVTSRNWSDRERFLEFVQDFLNRTPPRQAYYPGAAERFRRFSTDKPLGTAPETSQSPSNASTFPWTLRRDIDPRRSPHLVGEESFVCVCAETSLDAATPTEFLREAVDFVNHEVWGTLCAALTIPPGFRRVTECEHALQHAIAELRYGAVSINHWPALIYGLMSPPWGGFPGSTLADAQSGRGWVHNTYMLRGVEKTVLSGPLTVFPKPLWFPTHTHPDRVARRMLALYAHPTWLRWAALAASSLVKI